MLMLRWIEDLRVSSFAAARKRTQTIKRRILNMGRVKVTKGGASAAAAPASSDTDDLGLDDELGEPSDSELDDLLGEDEGLGDAADLGISTADVEAAMAGVVGEGASDAAISALTTEITKLGSSIEKLHKLVDAHAKEFKSHVEANATSFNNLTALVKTAPKAVTRTEWPTATPSVASSKLEGYLKAFWKSLQPGKQYPIPAIAAVVQKNQPEFTVEEVTKQIEITFAKPIKNAAKPGYFVKPAAQ